MAARRAPGWPIPPLGRPAVVDEDGDQGFAVTRRAFAGTEDFGQAWQFPRFGDLDLLGTRLERFEQFPKEPRLGGRD